MKENLQQALRRIRILEDRVDQLVKVKRRDEAILKSKKLFHLATSFTVILLLNENFQLFEELLGASLRAWETLMKLHVNYTFNLNWKKQVLAFELLALLHAQKRRYKTGLKAIYAAQTIVSELDETVERNLDYIMAVNTLTGFLLLSIQKPVEALEFVTIAERIVYRLIEAKKRKRGQQPTNEVNLNANKNLTSLEVIGERGQEEQLATQRISACSRSPHNLDASSKRIIGGDRRSSNQSEGGSYQALKFTTNSLNKDSAANFEVGTKRSCLSPTLLSNYVLAISLLKNIAMQQAYSDHFASTFDTYMANIQQVEQALFSMGSVDARQKDPQQPASEDDGTDGGEPDYEQMCNGVAVSFLIKQHKLEILDNESLTYSDIVTETFNKEFLNMLQVCIFVPFLHVETPKPVNVPKVAPLKESVVPQQNLIRDVLNYRMKIGQQQKVQETKRKELQRLQELGYQDNLAENSMVVGQQLSIDSYDVDSAPLESQDVQGIYQVPTQAQIKYYHQNSASQSRQPKTTKNKTSKRQARKFSQPSGQARKSVDVSMPQLSDINHFASMVDPRQTQQAIKKRRFKLSQDKGAMRRPKPIAALSPPAASHTRIASLQFSNQSKDASVQEYDSVGKPEQFSSKLQNLKLAVRKKSPTDQMAKTSSGTAGWTQKQKPVESSLQMGLPTLQAQRQTVTEGMPPQQPKSQSQPRRVRPTAYKSPTSINPTTMSDFTMLNSRPTEQIIAEKRAVDARMRQYKQGARQHDANIEKILASNSSGWASLYTHPKLMGQYYWKDDTINTNRQRATEIKNVIQSGFGQLKIKQSIRGQKKLSEGLIEPLERQSVHKPAPQ